MVEVEPPYRSVQDARKAHRNLSPNVLGLVEPIEIVEGDCYWDGLTTHLILSDAHGVTLTLCVKEAMSPSRACPMYFGVKYPADDSKPVAPGGPEEAAVHGLLLRWETAHCDPESPDPSETSNWKYQCGLVRLVLGVLDYRFSGAAMETQNLHLDGRMGAANTPGEIL